MSESTTWVFTCPLCGEILTAPKIHPDQTAVSQLSYHGALTLQRHITTHHPDLCQQFSNLVGQYTLALMVKCFETSDEAAIATRARLFDACMETLSKPWEVHSIVLPSGPPAAKSAGGLS